MHNPSASLTCYLHRKLLYILSASLCLLVALPQFALKAQNYGGSVTPGPDMPVARMSMTTVVLGDGRIVMIGGHGEGFIGQAAVLVYDPAANNFAAQHTLQRPRDGAAVIPLGGGRFMLVGGSARVGTASPDTTAEIYDAMTGQSSLLPRPLQNRLNAFGALLTSGDALVVGGWYDIASATTPDLWRASENRFIATGPLNVPRSLPYVFPTPDGGALVVGGLTNTGQTLPGSQVEYFDPATRTFTTVSDALIADDPGWQTYCSVGYPMSQMLLADGRYALPVYRPISGDTEYGLMFVDPVSRSFTLAPGSPYPYSGWPFVSQNGKTAHYYTIVPNSNPWQVQLITIDLENGKVNAPEDVFTFPANTYLGPGSSGIAWRPDGSLFVAGGSTSSDSQWNFRPHGKSYIFHFDAAPPPEEGEETWAGQGGGEGYDEIYSVAVDTRGFTYSAGAFKHTASYGKRSVSSAGKSDAVVVKRDQSGEVMWAVRAGGVEDDYAIGVSVDAESNVYVSGYFRATAEFSGRHLVSRGGSDMFLAKYGMHGNLLWVRQGGGAGLDRAFRNAVSAAGCVVVGAFSETATFESKTLNSKGAQDAFIALYDPDGSLLWISAAGGDGEDGAGDVSVGTDGGPLVSGLFSSAATFGGPSSGPQTSSASDITFTSKGGKDGFSVQYSADGVPLWGTQLGGPYDDACSSANRDGSGNVYVAVVFQGSADIGPLQLQGKGMQDAAVIKLAPDGQPLWAQSGGGVYIDGGATVMALPEGGCFLAGAFVGAVAFGDQSLVSRGISDGFILRYDEKGVARWSTSLGGSGQDGITCITVDSSGAVYAGGVFQESASIGGRALQSAGEADEFVVKISDIVLVVPAARGGRPQSIRVHCWPNPVVARLDIAVNFPTSGQHRVSLRDALGRELRVFSDGMHGAETLHVQAAVDDLAAGVYLLCVHSGDALSTSRIVVAR
ncbi:MAG: T9SS type A sorting domain-containing protein [Bacteroidia bacterium]|nr:T9SS type A sorting domain-containing protein [Bacteroidia bacterium]